jgi:hypothetical protein
VLEGVLGRDDHEGSLERVRRPVDRHLTLLHAFEERRLRLRRGPVDLVTKADVREHRSGLELELVGSLVPEIHPGDVGRQQVRGELDPLPRAVDRAGERLGQHRLAHSRDIFEQHMSFG